MSVDVDPAVLADHQDADVRGARRDPRGDSPPLHSAARPRVADRVRRPACEPRARMRRSPSTASSTTRPWTRSARSTSARRRRTDGSIITCSTRGSAHVLPPTSRSGGSSSGSRDQRDRRHSTTWCSRSWMAPARRRSSSRRRAPHGQRHGPRHATWRRRALRRGGSGQGREYHPRDDRLRGVPAERGGGRMRRAPIDTAHIASARS